MRKNTAENKLALSAALVFLLAFMLIMFASCKKTETSEKIGLRILYAGLPNTDRAKDFVDFLKKHFQQVETTDYKTFTGSYTAGFDVAIIDYDGLDTRAPLPNINRQYARATITMGVPGADLCSRLSLKTGYL